MSSGAWANADGLPLFFGTSKTNDAVGGDYLSYGDTREIEVLINMLPLTTSPVAQSYTTFFPAVAGTQYVMIEEVITMTDVAVTGTSAVFSVGLGTIAANAVVTSGAPAITSLSDTAFINAMPTTVIATLGSKNVLNITADSLSTYGGGYIGNAITLPASPAYITAKYATAAFTAGVVRVRIRYRGYNVISV